MSYNNVMRDLIAVQTRFSDNISIKHRLVRYASPQTYSPQLQHLFLAFQGSSRAPPFCMLDSSTCHLHALPHTGVVLPVACGLQSSKRFAAASQPTCSFCAPWVAAGMGHPTCG